MNFRLKHRGLNSIWGLMLASTMVSLISNNIRIPQLSAQEQTKAKVVATHNVICDLAESIIEDTMDLTCLLEGNQDPHSYSPSPRDRRALDEAQLILYGGYELLPRAQRLIEATSEGKSSEESSQVKLALYELAVADPIMAEAHDHGHDDHGHEEHGHDDHGHDDHAHDDHGHDDHGHKEHGHDDHGHDDHAHDDHGHEGKKSESAELAPDPHVWHDVENAIAIVEELQSTLIELNPQSEELYIANSSSLIQELQQLDTWISDMIETIPQGQRVLVTTHNALNYYVRAYNLEGYQTLQGLSTLDSPSATQVRDTVGEIQQANVPTIFAEAFKSDRVISNVAREADVELSPNKLYVDGLGDAASYQEMMTHNTCALVDGLGGACQSFTAAN
ncbi:MAG: metal ABC transporter substrate-binding protein [Cyanobacteria bacterium J06621_8]